MKMCVTGHRPNKLWGYNLLHPKYLKLKETFKLLLIEYNCEEGFSGMALGTDIVFAVAILELRDEGYDIKLHCAVPCLNQDKLWSKDDKILYNSILNRADTVTIVTKEPYRPYLMMKRNEYMVDSVDKVIALFDGTPGGTANCVRYAEKMGKEVIRINPADITGGEHE